MIQGTQWPSFIIQGIIIGSNLWFLVESDSTSNLWIFLSLIIVFTIFALQTTGVGFLYLYPVLKNEKGQVICDSVGIDTWILRVPTMLSITFLYLGILVEYPCW